MQKSIMERLDLLEAEHGQMSYDKQLGILGSEKIFSDPRQDDPSDFKTITDMHHDEMEVLSEMEEGNQLVIDGIDSIIDTMKTEVFKVRIMNAVNDLIRPLRDQMEILHLQDRLHAAEQHTDELYYYRGIIQAIRTLGTPNGGILNALMLEYRRFTSNPLWSTMRLTMTNILLPMVRGISNLLFGTGDRDSVEQKILKAIKQQTEFIRTGQIDQSDGFMKRLREQGILGMGARAAASSVGSAYLGISKGTAQEREQQRADGEQVTGGLSGWLSDRLYGGQTTLLDRTKHSTKSITEELQDAVLNVRIVDGVEAPTPSDTAVSNTQDFLLSDVLKDAYGSIKSDFQSVVEVVKRASKAPIEQAKKAMEYSYQAMNSGQVLDQQEQTGTLFPATAANQADEITVKAVVGGEDFVTLTDHVNRTNSNLVNLFTQNENFRDEEFLELQKRDKRFDMVSKMQMEMQEAANDDLTDIAKTSKAQYRVQQRTRRAIMLGNMMKLVGTIAGGVMDVVKGIGGLAATLVGAKAARGIFGGGGRRSGGRPAGRMPIRGLGIAGILSMGAGLITDRFTEEGTPQRRVGDTASSALGWGATGAMIGSVIPVIGTAVGGAVGAVAGALYANRDQFEGVIEGVRDTVTNIGSSISEWWSGTDEADGFFDRIGSKVSTIGENISGWWKDLKDNPVEKVMDVVAKASPFGLMQNAWNKTKGLFGGDDEASSERQSLGQVFPAVAPMNTVPTLQHQQLMRSEDYSVDGMMNMYRGIASDVKVPEDNSGWLYNRALHSGGQEVMARRNSDVILTSRGEDYPVGGMMNMYRGIASNAKAPEDNSGWLYNRALHSGGQEAMARRNAGAIPTSSREYIEGIPADIYRQRLLQTRSAEIADSIWDETVGQARGVNSPLSSEATDLALRNNGVNPSTGDGNISDIVTSGTMAERHRARRNEVLRRAQERVQENKQNAPLDIISSGGEITNTTNDALTSDGEFRTVAYDDEGVARRRSRRNEAQRRIQENRQRRRELQGIIEPSSDSTSSGVEINQLSRGVELTAPMSEQQTQERQSGVSIDAIMKHIDNVNKETLNKTDQEIGALAEIRSVLLDILNVSKQAGQGQAATIEPRVSPFDQSTITNVFGG